MKEYDSQIKRCRNCIYFQRVNEKDRSAKGKCADAPDGTELIGPGKMGCYHFYPNEETKKRLEEI